jgi:hypothetical protein
MGTAGDCKQQRKYNGAAHDAADRDAMATSNIK